MKLKTAAIPYMALFMQEYALGKFDRFILDCKNQADSKTESPCCNVSRRKSLCICAEKPETPRMPMMHWWCKAPCLCFWCPAPLTSGVPLMHSGRHYFHPGTVQQQQGMPWYALGAVRNAV